jgi:hypothetical protein
MTIGRFFTRACLALDRAMQYVEYVKFTRDPFRQDLQSCLATGRNNMQTAEAERQRQLTAGSTSTCTLAHLVLSPSAIDTDGRGILVQVSRRINREFVN